MKCQSFPCVAVEEKRSTARGVKAAINTQRLAANN